MFSEIAQTWDIESALYPGSYVDLSPSAAIASVTYVDTDRRAAKYFNDEQLLEAQLPKPVGSFDAVREVTFIHADYTEPLPVAAGSFDLLISLYAGFVWDACRQYLAPGGMLLANTSHGDASLAALDADLSLVAAIHQRSGTYRMDRENLDTYLVPKKLADADAIRRSGRGISYTRDAFAYLFQYTPGRQG